MRFPVIVRPTENGEFWSEVPTLPGCVSQGGTVEATIANTRGAIRVWLTYLHEKSLPMPDQDATMVTVDVDT